MEKIIDEQRYKEALESIEELLDAPPGSEDAQKLYELSIYIEAYEDKYFPID